MRGRRGRAPDNEIGAAGAAAIAEALIVNSDGAAAERAEGEPAVAAAAKDGGNAAAARCEAAFRLTLAAEVPGGLAAVVEAIAQASADAISALCGVVLRDPAAALASAAASWVDRVPPVAWRDAAGDAPPRLVVKGAGGRVLLVDAGDAAAARAPVLLVRQGEALEVDVDGARVESITLVGRRAAVGADAAGAASEPPRTVSLTIAASGVYVVRARDGAGEPFVVPLTLLVDERAPTPRVAGGGRLSRAPASPRRLLLSEALTADVA